MTRLWTILSRVWPTAAVSGMITLGEATGFNPVLVKPIFLFLLASAALLWILARITGPDGKRVSMLSPVDRIMCLYIIVVAFGTWRMPTSVGWLAAQWPVALLYAGLLLLAVIPPIIGRAPFTHWYARRTTPPAVWETDQFLTINRRMNLAWALLFALALASVIVGGLLGRSGSGPGVEWTFRGLIPGLLMLAVGWPFTRHYPAFAQRRMGIDPDAVAEAARTAGVNGNDRADEIRPGPALAQARPDDEPVAPTVSLTVRGRPAYGSAKEEIMSSRPKVVAVNGSPHVGIGNTCQMIDMLARALDGHGVDLEEISLHGKNIAPCVGCAVCLEKGKCWQTDDHKAITTAMLAADAVILASPVYIYHVTGQMKTFLDRCLPLGHKPRGTWKPGLAVSVSAGYGETGVADYLGNMLRIFGAFPVGSLTGLAVSPGGFLGLETVRARAADLARDLAVAIREKRRFPPSDRELQFWQFMGGLVRANTDIMADDDRHWREKGLYDSFEAYVGQEWSPSNSDPEMRKAWVRQLIADSKQDNKQAAKAAAEPEPEVERKDDMPATGAKSAANCAELIKIMPLGFNAEAAGDVSATVQFNITGDEEFTAHLAVADGKCEYFDGPAEAPDLTIISPAKVWLAISRGEKNGQMAFMTGKFKAKGDLGLLMKLNSLFKG